jgi:4-oxalocrotonate tautomerase family enzyme
MRGCLYFAAFTEGGNTVPFIQCDIRRGRSDAQRKQLCERITRTVSRITGAPTGSILVLIREHAGDHFMEGAELLPDYVAGPNGEDVAAEAALKRVSN